VRAARAAGFEVVPVPGPSALAAIMSASGQPETAVVFEGFPPNRSNDRIRWAARVASETKRATVCFEAPHRLLKTLAVLDKFLGKRPILVGREVTKLHEEWREGTAEELLDYFQHPQGEFVLMIQPSPGTDDLRSKPDDQLIADVFGRMIESSAFDRRGALRATAEHFQIPVKVVYAAIERTKKLG
jgi:16S rRNA (cytidine1402-2'-O)-methyltransferase